MVQYVLIVRERLLPGSEDAYDRNEVALARACAMLHCPHPYLALATVTGPAEVWWLNAFASPEERDGLQAAYASNQPLMAALRTLGKRKEGLRVIDIGGDDREPVGPVFQAGDGQRFALAPAFDRSAVEDLTRRAGSAAIVAAVQPQWSFPAESWIAADPDFWRSGPGHDFGDVSG